jgi:transposase
VLEPLLPVSNNRCGRWRELPERFGPWRTAHKRHLLWAADGTWERLLQHVQAVAEANADGDIASGRSVSSACQLLASRGMSASL